MAFVDFYCNASSGSNLNGGSDAGTVTYTSTNGNWGTPTGNIFTPTDGTNPATSGVTVGQFCSIYIDGATVSVFIAKITAVQNASNGTITVSSSLRAGPPPSTSATGRSIKVGGAWKGPNAASSFPLDLASIINLAGSGNKLAINLKNNANYAVTASINQTSSQNVLVQGYSSAVRDGGKAVIDGGTSGASYILLNTSASAGWSHIDLIFQHNGASGVQSGVNVQAIVSFIRCVFSGMGGNGAISNTGSVFSECEFFGNNLSNTSNFGGVSGPGDFLWCASHDNTGSNTSGFYVSASGAAATYQNCIADTNGSVGFNISVTGGATRILNCDAYNNTSDGIQTTGPSGLFLVTNCNLIKNGGWGINMAGSPNPSHEIRNCGFGSGTQANTSGATTGIYAGQETGSITYGSNLTPWVDPANGDFRISLAAAKNAGRGVFTETAASYAGTVGYPDIGAAQHLETGGGQKSHTFGA